MPEVLNNPYLIVSMAALALFVILPWMLYDSFKQDRLSRELKIQQRGKVIPIMSKKKKGGKGC